MGCPVSAATAALPIVFAIPVLAGVAVSLRRLVLLPQPLPGFIGERNQHRRARSITALAFITTPLRVRRLRLYPGPNAPRQLPRSRHDVVRWVPLICYLASFVLAGFAGWLAYVVVARVVLASWIAAGAVGFAAVAWLLMSALSNPSLYDGHVDHPAWALALGGILLVPPAARGSRPALIGAIALFTLAVWTKQTAIAAPAAGVIWLCFQGPSGRRVALLAHCLSGDQRSDQCRPDSGDPWMGLADPVPVRIPSAGFLSARIHSPRISRRPCAPPTADWCGVGPDPFASRPAAFGLDRTGDRRNAVVRLAPRPVRPGGRRARFPGPSSSGGPGQRLPPGHVGSHLALRGGVSITTPEALGSDGGRDPSHLPTCGHGDAMAEDPSGSPRCPRASQPLPCCRLAEGESGNRSSGEPRDSGCVLRLDWNGSKPRRSWSCVSAPHRTPSQPRRRPLSDLLRRCPARSSLFLPAALPESVRERPYRLIRLRERSLRGTFFLEAQPGHRLSIYARSRWTTGTLIRRPGPEPDRWMRRCFAPLPVGSTTFGIGRGGGFWCDLPGAGDRLALVDTPAPYSEAYSERGFASVKGTLDAGFVRGRVTIALGDPASPPFALSLARDASAGTITVTAFRYGSRLIEPRSIRPVGTAGSANLIHVNFRRSATPGEGYRNRQRR